MPESIVIEENQVIFEEPSVSCREIKLETGAIRIETNESETRETRNKEAEEDYKEDEKPLRAQRSKISFVKFMKNVAVSISKQRSNVEVVKEPVQFIVTVETEVQNNMENETNKVEESEEVQPLDKHEQQHKWQWK